MDLSTLEPMTLTCPRCHTEVQQRLYGPCADCIDQLYDKFQGVAREIESEPRLMIAVQPTSWWLLTIEIR